MDPVISPGNSMGTIDKGHNQFGIAWQSTYRKDIWSSREEAAKSFQKSPFYQSWDPRVLDLWIKYGLRDLPTALYPESSDTGPPAVTLTTSRPQEVWSFLRPNYDGENEDGSPRINKSTHPDVDPESKLKYPFYRPELRSVYLKLPSLRPPTFYIMGGTSNLGSREFQREKVPETGIGVGGSGGEKEGKVGHVFLKGIGHLVPMEAPILSAEVTSQWIRNILAAWFEETEEFEKSWSEVGKRAKIMLNKSWFDHIGPRPSRSGRKHKL